MPFNEYKCHVLHIGRTNAKHQYIMGGIQLLGVKQERDVGVIIADSLRPSIQCAKSAKKANAEKGCHLQGQGVLHEPLSDICQTTSKICSGSLVTLDFGRQGCVRGSPEKSSQDGD